MHGIASAGLLIFPSFSAAVANMWSVVAPRCTIGSLDVLDVEVWRQMACWRRCTSGGSLLPCQGREHRWTGCMRVSVDVVASVSLVVACVF